MLIFPLDRYPVVCFSVLVIQMLKMKMVEAHFIMYLLAKHQYVGNWLKYYYMKVLILVCSLFFHAFILLNSICFPHHPIIRLKTSDCNDELFCFYREARSSLFYADTLRSTKWQRRCCCRPSEWWIWGQLTRLCWHHTSSHISQYHVTDLECSSHVSKQNN